MRFTNDGMQIQGVEGWRSWYDAVRLPLGVAVATGIINIEAENRELKRLCQLAQTKDPKYRVAICPALEDLKEKYQYRKPKLTPKQIKEQAMQLDTLCVYCADTDPAGQTLYWIIIGVVSFGAIMALGATGKKAYKKRKKRKKR